MNSSDLPASIPPSSFPFFQEYIPTELDVQQHAALIIERILAYGNRAEVRWLIDTYDRGPIQDWLKAMGSQRLPWRRYHLWCQVFHLPMKDKPVHIWPY